MIIAMEIEAIENTWKTTTTCHARNAIERGKKCIDGAVKETH
jgi:hypothetical protein